jgi:hypothetical protein
VSVPDETEVVSQVLLPLSVVIVQETGQAQLPPSFKVIFCIEELPTVKERETEAGFAVSEQGKITERATAKFCGIPI